VVDGRLDHDVLISLLHPLSFTLQELIEQGTIKEDKNGAIVWGDQRRQGMRVAQFGAMLHFIKEDLEDFLIAYYNLKPRQVGKILLAMYEHHRMAFVKTTGTAKLTPSITSKVMVFFDSDSVYGPNFNQRNFNLQFHRFNIPGYSMKNLSKMVIAWSKLLDDGKKFKNYTHMSF